MDIPVSDLVLDDEVILEMDEDDVVQAHAYSEGALGSMEMRCPCGVQEFKQAGSDSASVQCTLCSDTCKHN
eukprot:3937301-Rhodomonas_salina.1